MEPNSTFGSYRLLELLGEGGTGKVWKAVDLRLERVVALKLLKVVDAVQRSVLLIEAKTACQLLHPHIAVIYEVGEAEGAPYLAMEFAEGQTLRRQAKAPQPEALLRRVLEQAASALAHAHQKGIIHRDIKPDNLLLTPQGDLKLLDFGVAKRSLLPADETASEGFTITGETGQGISIGTPGYMSPEQAHGFPLTAATDQFSLGIVLFELAIGFHPFRKKTLLGTLQAIAQEPAPDLAEARPELSPTLVGTLRRMVEKAPEQRFPSMEALLASLSNAAPPPLPALARSEPRAPRGLAWKAGSAALVLLVGILGWHFLGRRPAFPAARTGQTRRAVAILPLELQGLPSDKQWLGDSFQDAMATGLLRRGDLTVLDRARVAETLADARSARGPRQVSSELGAELLLMGTLQASGNHLRVGLRLIRGQTGEVVDQISFDGNLADPLALEDDLGKRIPGLFGATQTEGLPGGSQARLPRTRECYIRGLELVDQASSESSQGAIEAFEEALRSEPDYAPAHAGLAWALGSLHSQETHLGNAEAPAHLNRALVEAQKAVALDPRLPIAHRTLGQILRRLDDPDGARQALQKAIELDPADYRALAILGDIFAYLDDEASHAQARSYLRRALEMHPRDWWANFRLAVLLQNEGDLRASVFHADRAQQLEPSADYAYLVAAISLLWLGDLPGAAQRAQEGLRQVPASGLLQVTQILCDHAQGDHAAFRNHSRAKTVTWAETHPVGILLRGLADSEGGRGSAMRERFLAFAARNRARDARALQASERRALSVNAYHMAHCLAQEGYSGAARTLLAEAERMLPGKLKVAAQDPVLAGMLNPLGSGSRGFPDSAAPPSRSVSRR